MGDISLKVKGRAIMNIAKDLKKSSKLHGKQSNIISKMINKDTHKMPNGKMMKNSDMKKK